MKVDISRIMKFNGGTQDFNFVETIPSLKEEMNGYIVESPVSFSGTVTNIQGVFSVNGILKYEYITKCVKCLKPLSDTIEKRISEMFESSESKEGMDSYIFTNDEIDLELPVIHNIILSLPQISVCSEDCKGLCPKCGTNLNISECDCDNSNINLNMLGLKEFFTDKK